MCPLESSQHHKNFRNDLIQGLENITVIHDDVIIFGSCDVIDEATAFHDVAFKKVEEEEPMLQAQ